MNITSIAISKDQRRYHPIHIGIVCQDLLLSKKSGGLSAAIHSFGQPNSSIRPLQQPQPQLHHLCRPKKPKTEYAIPLSSTPILLASMVARGGGSHFARGEHYARIDAGVVRVGDSNRSHGASVPVLLSTPLVPTRGSGQRIDARTIVGRAATTTTRTTRTTSRRRQGKIIQTRKVVDPSSILATATGRTIRNHAARRTRTAPRAALFDSIIAAATTTISVRQQR
mmetsp:Transcript_8702/g.18834  ORF Transcript_8702/g.18834 Transcript_8702/m.18834 type:complete len:225 (-) Transcript_8702:679-1353(-)